MKVKIKKIDGGKLPEYKRDGGVFQVRPEKQKQDNGSVREKGVRRWEYKSRYKEMRSLIQECANSSKSCELLRR